MRLDTKNTMICGVRICTQAAHTQSSSHHSINMVGTDIGTTLFPIVGGLEDSVVFSSLLMAMEGGGGMEFRNWDASTARGMFAASLAS